MIITMKSLRLLPSYTTERYYILSEIEDTAAFEPLDTDEGVEEMEIANKRAKEILKDDRKVCDAFYLLWDLRDEANKPDSSFMDDVKRISAKIGQLNSILKWSICCIEIVVNSAADWESCGLGKRVFDMMKWMEDFCGFGCIYIGICDSVGGAPALEAILDYSKMIEDHNLHSALLVSELRVLRVVVLNMSELLGHDPSREPDAVSGVYQAEYVQANAKYFEQDLSRASTASTEESTINNNTTISAWADSVGLDHQKIVRDSNGQRGTNISLMKSDVTRSTTSLFLFILACIAAYLFQLLSS